MTGPFICLRQGYECSCKQCQIWISRWADELEGFLVADSMMRDGATIFEIYERLRASHPDILRYHHKSIQDQYFNYIKANKRKLRVKLKQSAVEVEDAGEEVSSSSSETPA